MPRISSDPETSRLYSTGRRLRASEWTLVVFFAYIAAISQFFHLRSQEHAAPFLIAGIVTLLLVGVAHAEEYGNRSFVSYSRDWLTLALVFVAYREMDWFTLKELDHHLENSWIIWDRALLQASVFRGVFESTGALLPGLLELSYLLVYAVGPFTVATLYVLKRRDQMSWVLFVYVAGTVAAYGLFPYFPSSPPRVVFPNADLPAVTTALRRINLFLVGGYGIHSSVFPSAHVSSAFSAAWGIRVFLPEQKKLGWLMAGYAVLVSLATVYGRYHYAVDALAGLGISLLAAGLAMAYRAKRRRREMPDRLSVLKPG